ncbi:flagellar biosynthetic protein FliQ [Clostridium saccharobutylicum]|uniref:Export protein FliQ, family 3 n=1 Tax=Clostridium saccharobutylicum DSM 13864 TaxID=1345695 RepID=U5MWJ4_CLOSA|nr:flagellar biosynthetic protein FliQ [Clostridium saccharobutylicum]AGX44883.1 export protein FliQ, family 3 [Clostridium saccharobutylicum DSM 13864]AQR92165.1 flagellar biosynthetic protein FliQ [Clostridium saccharobutylicum]AQS02067.1 flagellar biosynthetic protein FliQ [Clostridium saccharobutylicum]AQS11671.1 flagellar biosynthetic protein FliQ [Clostridium saccharobutylicum]AQS16050.1 flagellar biosynthetic protein FliQ [Clostridium saccharobutylicum]
MTQVMLSEVVKDTIVTAAKVSAPILIVVLVLGLVISILQATTQIQEQTLTFLPKLIAAAVVGIFLGSWMLQTVMSFTTRIFDLIARITT